MKGGDFVEFKLDKDKDMWNWWDACNDSYMGVDWKQRTTPEIRAKLVGKTQKEAKDFLREYLEKKIYSTDKFLKAQKEIEFFWKNIELEIIKRIENITKKTIWPSKITCYYTTFPRGPYRFNLKTSTAYILMDPIGFSPKERFCRSIVHEMLHFQMHKYFWKYLQEKNLTDKQVDHIKEALTFLLNENFIDLFKVPEKGYEIHDKLREDLAKFWRESNNFLELLDYASVLIKEKYSNLT